MVLQPHSWVAVWMKRQASCVQPVRVGHGGPWFVVTVVQGRPGGCGVMLVRLVGGKGTDDVSLAQSRMKLPTAVLHVPVRLDGVVSRMERDDHVWRRRRRKRSPSTYRPWDMGHSWSEWAPFVDIRKVPRGRRRRCTWGSR